MNRDGGAEKNVISNVIWGVVMSNNKQMLANIYFYITRSKTNTKFSSDRAQEPFFHNSATLFIEGRCTNA